MADILGQDAINALLDSVEELTPLDLLQSIKDTLQELPIQGTVQNPYIAIDLVTTEMWISNLNVVIAELKL